MAGDGAAFDQFGGSVTIGETTAIVGARLHTDNGPESGSAYLFDAATGQQLLKFLSSDGALGDLFGRSVRISGTTAIVGAVLDDDFGGASGSTYLFDARGCVAPICPADIDGDGVLDSADLGILIEEFGTVCAP